ncbi:MAG: RagB/SusD family nutrient uptake outer membrane protein [Bacteroidaceae bacterium]|nr:RagB/SusD family nutrient uptake outer membrane protein [Bacteroidaceae bacterium]
MKKDNIKLAATLGLVALSMASCSNDFLTMESKSESNTESYYKTEADAYDALTGVYDGWQRTTSSETVGFYLASEVMADECYGATGNTDSRTYQVIDRFDKGQSSSELNIFAGDWQNYYAAIHRANSLIMREGQISWSSDKTHGTYIGEARAIRAMCYFDMVRLWGNIPLITDLDFSKTTQDDPKDVYALIISDLKYAAENIPEDAYPKSEAATNDGRVTKYAAEALLARVYLFYTGYYGEEPADLTKAEALAYVEDVISSQKYSLVPEFKNLWRPSSVTWTQDDGGNWTCSDTYAGRGNSETILAQKFNYTSDYNGLSDGNRWQVMIAPRSMIIVPYGQGWGGCTVNPKLVNAYPTGDMRKTASVIDFKKEGLESEDAFSTGYNDWREYTGYGIKKYCPLAEWYQAEDGSWNVTNEVQNPNTIKAGEFQISPYHDFVVMRYADVLLMAAELGSANAQSYFNMVHERAYFEGGSLGSNYKQIQVSQSAIMNERRLEFAFEGLRYWDLLRQGVETAANTIAESTTVTSGGLADEVVIKKENIIATKGLSQIPYDQISYSNGTLIQNDGWK